MNRKHFLGTTGVYLAGISLPLKKNTNSVIAEEHLATFTIPPYLKTGHSIGITCPAGPVTREEIQPAVSIMEAWGFRVVIGNTVGKKEFTRGGSDEERLEDLQKMLDDPSIKAIMCARGGYGCIRIVDRIDWTRFKKNPKWIIGFSDITVLHGHIHQVGKVACIHSKMTNSFPADLSVEDTLMTATIDSIHQALTGKKMKYELAPHPQNRKGTARGILVGGNLKTIESLSGSSSDIKTDGKILFVEDTGEYLYSIDRMFWNLKRTGKLHQLQALIVGGFKIKPDDPGDEFGKTLQEIVLEKVKQFSYPVCFDFPVGHQKANFALKCGVPHHLLVHDDEVNLTASI